MIGARAFPFIDKPRTLKTKMKKTPAWLALALLSGGPLLALTPGDEDEILFIKQEEKLARDVYLALGEAWGTQVFLNIAQSEQRHMNAVDGLIATYGLADSSPEALGEFTIPALTDLYATLIEKGMRSETDALEVGVLIEETDIDDLEVMIAQIEDSYVDRVLGNLLRGSYNHLEAFGAVLDGT